MITRFYLRLLSTNVKHPKSGCHVTSLCQGLRRNAGSGGEDPENQVGGFGEISSLHEGNISSNPPSGGSINDILYRK